MNVSFAPALLWLMASNQTPSSQTFDLAELERSLTGLPGAAQQVESCNRLISLTNRLIEIGPANTWQLLDQYLAKQPQIEKSENFYLALPGVQWCQVLALLPLLIEGSDDARLGDVKYVPTYFEDGLVFQTVFVYSPNDLTPRSLREALRTVDWRKFRKSAIGLKPENATSKGVHDFLVRRFKGNFYLDEYIATMTKQNPPGR